MHTFWKIKDSKENKLILIKDNCIYKGNPKEQDLKRINTETQDISFLKELFSIPYSYIKKIENQKGRKHIKVMYGKDSEDKLIVNNESLKNEIFEFLKLNMSHFDYTTEMPNILRYVKPQLFALLIVSGIFMWSLYLAIQIKSGVHYEIVGGRPGLTGIVLVIASLGTTQVILGYLVLLLLIIFVLRKKLKTRTKVDMLTRKIN